MQKENKARALAGETIPANCITAPSSQLGPMQCDEASAVVLELSPEQAQSINAGRLEEDIMAGGQLVLNYTVEGFRPSAGTWEPLPFVHGASVGYRVVDFYDGSGPDAGEFSPGGEAYVGHDGKELSREAVGAGGSPPLSGFTKVRFRCTAARQEPVQLKWFGLYSATRPSA